jgi:5-oxoprolinase (ATP-hydrolysing)
MEELISEYGLEVVVAYMHHGIKALVLFYCLYLISFSVQNNAEQAVRDMLKEVSLRFNVQPVDILHAEDFMDDGL